MKKRLIALTILLCMLVSVSPTVAADDTVPRPTVEEILSEYHEEAFEEKVAEKSGGMSAYSRGADNSEKTLEEETVDTLNAAGYEAYNVTSENYATLEEQLQTDFAQMGMDPDGSYIIAISGEDNSPGNNARIPTPEITPTLPPDGGGGGSSYFSYTYNGTTYYMRYVTITGDDNEELSMTSAVDLLAKYEEDDLWDNLELPITLLSSIGVLSYTGAVYSLLSPLVSCYNPARTKSLVYNGGTNWTIKYIQVYNHSDKVWELGSSVEYVKMRQFIDYYYYSATTNQVEKISTEGTYATQYSTYYNDSDFMKERAAYAFERGTYWLDEITDVTYKIDGETVIRHYRPFPELNYIPQ